ncbi:Protein N-acetyltransferase, RimJ/RimL family [Paucidesulfovibrio gracilis DSM 16080]|uniref:Protein N-acetyltransferase, RimJ/RimL family n=1 Tax=Paucidesulfovibrio gracilis DSM 16080 TaxID=1121449 RepID=A0A1T4WCI7_9BACT|nr:GNAT family N-acetyltransferase [Paucidesulfovibrio gracilis]SKA75016.1 Protein N-acetyltransferase, RimJ/RimL family [Paucidesulfovibrio gracilis DSM 16080]
MTVEGSASRSGSLIRLRPSADGDAAFMVDLLGEDRESVMRMARMPWPLNEDGARHWLRTVGASGTTFAVLRAEDRAYVGCIGLWPIAEADGGVAELGYWIGRTYWNQGYASAAVKLVLEVARRQGLDCLQATVKPDNAVSRHILEKYDFVLAGERLQHQPLRGGEQTVLVYERDMEVRQADHDRAPMREALRRRRPRDREMR